MLDSNELVTTGELFAGLAKIGMEYGRTESAIDAVKHRYLPRGREKEARAQSALAGEGDSQRR